MDDPVPSVLKCVLHLYNSKYLPKVLFFIEIHVSINNLKLHEDSVFCLFYSLIYL